MNIKNIIYYVSIGIVLIFSFYLQGFLGIISLIFFVFLYGNIFYVLHIIWRKIRKKEFIKYFLYLLEFAKKISFGFILIAIILGSFAYYENKISPAKMPEFTISNGEKTVVFQAMSHIGNTEFYEQIKQNLTDAKKNGYVYFFEGVKPGNKENSEKFNKAIGIKFDKELYKNFSKLYGVSHQDNSIYYGLVNELDFNVDVSMDYIMKEYDKKIASSTGTINSSLQDKLPIDANKQILESLASLNERELKLLVYINQALLNFIIKSEGIQNSITNNFANQILFEIILDGRNDVLANEIINSKYKKIYVTYGLLHFKGVLELLQKDDSNWKIINEKYLVPIR